MRRSARVSLQYSLQVKQIFIGSQAESKLGEHSYPIIETHKSHKFSFDQN